MWEGLSYGNRPLSSWQCLIVQVRCKRCQVHLWIPKMHEPLMMLTSKWEGTWKCLFMHLGRALLLASGSHVQVGPLEPPMYKIFMTNDYPHVKNLGWSWGGGSKLYSQPYVYFVVKFSFNTLLSTHVVWHELCWVFPPRDLTKTLYYCSKIYHRNAWPQTYG